MARSRRDPEFTPLEYLTEIVERVKKQSALLTPTIANCEEVLQSTENSLPWLLKTNSTTRQKALDLLVFISGVPDTETSPNQLFALRFLEKNKKDG